MNEDIITLELAGMYESQGYWQEALKIYSILDSGQTSKEIKAGFMRMEKRVKDAEQSFSSQENISQLFEKWLTLMVLQQRLDNLKKMRQEVCNETQG